MGLSSGRARPAKSNQVGTGAQIHVVHNSPKRKPMPVIFDRLLCISSMGVPGCFQLNIPVVRDANNSVIRDTHSH